MSEDSHSNGSAGSIKGLRGLFGKKDRSVAPESLNRYDQNSPRARKPSMFGGFQSRKEDYSPGILGLDRYGYEKYNVMESEIYISCPPESAAFDDMEPTIIRATNGNVVGSRDERVVEEPAAPTNRVSQLYDPFESIDTGSSLPKNFGCVHGSVRDGEVVRDNAAPELPKLEYSTEIDSEGILFRPVTDEPAEVPEVGSGEELIEAPTVEPAEVPVDEPAEEAIEIPVINPVEEVAAVAAIAEADDWFDAAIESEEIRADTVDAAVESSEVAAEPEDVSMEASMVEPVEHIAAAEEFIEEPAEAPVEVSAVEPIVVVPVLPENKFEGLYIEGKPTEEPSTVDDTVIGVPKEPEAVVTSTDAAPAPNPRIEGIDTEGASVLPPMSVNPAKPRVRFKFINGVLTKVIEEEPTEPDEGLRGPFDIAAGQAVERIGPAKPKTVDDDFVLEMDEFDTVPEPEYGDMAFDDALESLTFDAVPPTVIAELIELLPLSFPEMGAESETAPVEYEDDNLDAVFFAEPVRFEVPELPAMIGAASETLMIGAAGAEPLAIGTAEPMACITAPDLAALPAPAALPEATPAVSGVMFSFGAGAGAGCVTFSF